MCQSGLAHRGPGVGDRCLLTDMTVLSSVEYGSVLWCPAGSVKTGMGPIL